VKNRDNWNEYKQILNERTFEGEIPYSDKDLREMFDSVSIHDSKTQLERNRDGGGLHVYLKDLRSFLAENGMLKKDFTPETIFDNRAIVTTLQGMQ
jgi:NitT/TauT family transport system substrate-binding protein